MKELDIEIAKLVPAQGRLFRGLAVIEEYARIIEILPRIPVISLENSLFLTCDGHHRTAAHIIAEKSNAKVVLIETEEDRKKYNAGYLFGRTIEKVREAYFNEWKDICEKFGIINFYDYPEVKEGLAKNG